METVFYNKGGPRAYSSRDRHLLDGISHHGVVRLVLLGRRHDLAEVRRVEVVQEVLGVLRRRRLVVLPQQPLDRVRRRRAVLDPSRLHVRELQATGDHVVVDGRIVQVGDAVRHALAAVVAGALDDGLDTGVADAEPVSRLPSREELSGSRTIETSVADDNTVLGLEDAVRLGLSGRIDADMSTGQALAQPGL